MIYLSSHEDIAYFMTPTTPSLQGERGSEENLCLRELAKVDMEELLSLSLLLLLILSLLASLSIAVVINVDVAVPLAFAFVVPYPIFRVWFCLTLCRDHRVPVFCHVHRVSVYFAVFTRFLCSLSYLC